ncbi:MAG: asparagine synthase (glutamine-hydrolyzing) [Methanobacteriota archaeon]|nr:MAG: asparagine synthase (glutamine-hydrolyzing) [Euryarchaeota archaeon]
MCGIFALINNTYENPLIKSAFNKGQSRGPEHSNLCFGKVDASVVFGFHRLAINGLDEMSHQPLIYENCSLICNGEIYNCRQLAKDMKIKLQTNSDCEIIIYLYTKYGMTQTLTMLDGVFAFVLMDYKKNTIYAARDPYGVRPLFIAKNNNNFYGFASLMKQLIKLDTNIDVSQFPPGHYVKFSSKNNEKNTYTAGLNIPFSSVDNISIDTTISTEQIVLSRIRTSLEYAVKKRVYNTDRDIACLLSGGLDSSLIASLVSKFYKNNAKTRHKQLHTWSIGLAGSEDLEHAKLVAEWIGSQHHTIQVTADDLLEAIDKVIYHTETYDTTSVRASVPNWLISKHIKEYEKYSDAKVIFNGDGSDEVSGGYLYFHYIKDPFNFDIECKNLLKNIHYFDVLRSDRSISSHGLEARTPFLDRGFVQTYLSIPPNFRCPTTEHLCEKFLIRRAFDDGKTLPKKVLWRTKEAFSDGVSQQNNSWHEIIKKFVKTKIFTGENYPDNDTEIINSLIIKHNITVNPPKTLEQLFYRLIFEKYFPNKGDIIPYFWMHKYSKSDDASARSLDIYSIRNVS